MLKTALQPKWIAMLVLVLLIATVFVVLSAWQFGQSRSEGNPIEAETETPVPLVEVYEPERSMTVYEADRIVDLSGEFVEGTQVAISERLRDGETGYWLVGAFRVDSAPADEVIPLVRGWVSDLSDVSDLPTDEDILIRGRLLPPEAPGEGQRETPGVYPSLSVAELINVWDEPSYSGFIVAFDMQARGSGADLMGGGSGASTIEPVWVGPQPEGDNVNWLNLFYGVEWTVFAGFAFYFWWRMVRDAHLKEAEEARLDKEWQEQWRQEYLAERAQHARSSPSEPGQSQSVQKQHPKSTDAKESQE